MEATALSVGKSVLGGALSYAKSTVAEEVALQLGVRRDQVFITSELEMMQAFLMVVHDEGKNNNNNNNNKIVKVWVKQVRDVAYDVEDCLLDLAVLLEKQSWWRTLFDRRHVTKRMKDLRASVEDVSQRNLRYNLIKGSSTAEQSAAVTGATMSGTDEARRQREKANLILVGLISHNRDTCLKVISVWEKGSTGDPASVVKRAYEYIKVQNKFECQAFIRFIYPFSSIKFLQDVVQQFYTNYLQEAGGLKQKATLSPQVLKMLGMTKGDDLAILAHELEEYLKERSYLIVLDGITSTEEWECVKTYFPDNKKGSRIILCTEQIGVASLCVGADNAAPEHTQLFADQTLHVFYKGSHDGTDSVEMSGSSSNEDHTVRCNNSYNRKVFNRIDTVLTALKESELIGREKEKTEITRLITNEDVSQECEVISVWGMGGLGKTTLVRDVYQSQELSGKFEKRACVTIMHPFDQKKLFDDLAKQFGCDPADWIEHLAGKKYLIVLDDLLSNTEWDTIIPYFPANKTSSRIIVTTRVMEIAKHCSKKHENVYELHVLEHKNARDLFVDKVFGKTPTNLDEQYPELVEPANMILKKCNGLPLAIVTIGGFLSNQPKTILEWTKLNDHISVELEMNPELETIRAILMKSYDGLPYHLKACFLYLSIFPEDFEISCKRLLRRWIAEGYSSAVGNKSAEDMAKSYLMELIGRSMLLSFYIGKRIDSWTWQISRMRSWTWHRIL